MAPEIVSETAYDYTIDIWSLGILLYEMLHGQAPFRGKQYKEIAASIKAGNLKFSSSLNQDAIDLIKSILVKDPS
jgi:serine/threonine protein kinase